MVTLLKDESSISTVISQMTLNEKLRLLVGDTMFRSVAMEKYGIPSIYYLDGATGVNFKQIFMDIHSRLYREYITDPYEALFGADNDDDTHLNACFRYADMAIDQGLKAKATLEQKENLRKYLALLPEYLPDGKLPSCFPPGILLGATWNEEIIYNTANALGQEARSFNIDVLLGPNINIHRDPLNGRLFEGYSEDPYLISRLAPAFVRGLQDTGVIAVAKHFVANNQETNRCYINEIISERALREIYFPGFKACVDAGCFMIMSAYNSINGTPCAMNHWLLTDILKNEWGFKGAVISDWAGAYDQVSAYRAGNDMDMPGPRSIQKVIDAIKSQKLNESVIDESLRRVLNTVLKTPAMKKSLRPLLNRECSRHAAYNSAKEGIVLLKNNGVLPLASDCCVALFGPRSQNLYICGKGSANVITEKCPSLYECIEDIVGKRRVFYNDISINTSTIIVTVGSMGQENSDRIKMEIESEDKNMLLNVIKAAKKANKRIIVILNVCGPVAVNDFIDEIDGLICAWLPGMEGARAVADILWGRVNPSGKLPVTFPNLYMDTPTFGNFPGENGVTYYQEGVFVGYRHYDRQDITPQFPFGFGLSYTQFQISDGEFSTLRLSISKKTQVMVRCSIRNIGKRDGKEVVQMYIGKLKATPDQPLRELKGFKKVFVSAGEKVDISLLFTVDDLKYWDEKLRTWKIALGEYQVWVGTSSRDFAFKHIVSVFE